MNLKRFQGVSRLVVVIGLLSISLEMVAPPVPVVHADFPAGVGFDGSASLDSENPPYFTQPSATFLNPSAVRGTASYTWPGNVTTAWPDFAWWYGFTTDARSYTTYEFSLTGAHPGPDWCVAGYPQLRLVARGYPGYLAVDSPDGHYLATFPWPVELSAIKVYGRGCNVPGYHEDWGFVLNLLSVDGNTVPTAPPTPTPGTPVSLHLADAQGNTVSALGLSDEGWLTPNPITVEITLNCPADGDDCAYPFTLRLEPPEAGPNQKPRFYVYDQDANSDGLEAICQASSVSPSPYSYWRYLASCAAMDATTELSVPAGGAQTLRWFVWIQPSDEAALEFSVSWGAYADSQTLPIPRAAIHPIVFIPGLGATEPPTYSQRAAARTILKTIGQAAHYNDLWDTLQKMGYEDEKTLFAFPYNWLRSNVEGASHLHDRLESAALTAAQTPWVAGAPNSASISFDLIGHSTGNLVARSYIQVDQWTDPIKGETHPVWQAGRVRRWVSIAGPLKGIFDGYQRQEGPAWKVQDNPIFWGAFYIWLPMMAYQAKYTQKICLPFLRCAFTWSREVQYQFAHDPIRGPNILPEFLPTDSYLVNNNGIPSDPDLARAEPFGRMANPLLEDGSARTGFYDDVNRIENMLDYPTAFSADLLLLGRQAMAGKVFDPYTHNRRLHSGYWGDTVPGDFKTHYYGLNTPAAMQTLNTRLGGVDRNVCLIYGEGLPNDTPKLLEVADPSQQGKAPYWFNGRTETITNTVGDNYVAGISANPQGIWQGGQPSRKNVDVDITDPTAPKSSHTFIVGYDKTLTEVARCLTGFNNLPQEILPGFSQAGNDIAQSQAKAMTNRVLAITALSPVELMLTDPLGRRLGYDPATGGEFSEIPDADYFRDELTTHKYLTLYAPEVGDYTLTATGTGNGPYTLLSTFKEGENIVSPFLITGEAEPSGTYVQTFSLPETAAEISTPPQVEVGPDVSAEAGTPVTMSGEVEDLNPNETFTLAWDFGDGATVVDTLTPSHVYVDAGVYTATLTVTDSTGFVISDTLQATISEAPTATPTATNIATDIPSPTTTATETMTPTNIPAPAATDTATFTPTPTPTSTPYPFSGFFSPVNNQPMLNVLKAGNAVPVKFTLNGYQGMSIFASGYPASAMVTCGSAVEDTVEQTVTAGASSLSYDASVDQYIYVWKTDKAWANTCRTLVLKLTDGTYHRANFKFT
jgi:PKD repeat protein